jgi:hypothetical protein
MDFKKKEQDFLKEASKVIEYVTEENLSLYEVDGSLYLVINKEDNWELYSETLYYLEAMGIDGVEYNTKSFVHM